MVDIQKIQSAVLDMMKKVKFDEKKHVYTEVETGKWLQGVSTVSSIVPKDWLAAWGSKEAVKALGYSDYEGDTGWAENIFECIKECDSVYDYLAILKDAKGAASRKSKDALIDGRKGHEWLESLVKSRIRKSKVPIMPDGMLKRPLKQFIEWEFENVKQWILSEARVARPDLGFAGTLDALAEMKSGKLALIDYKFSSHIAPEYFLQTAGYQCCFEPYDIQIDERIIVRLPKTLEKDEWNAKEHKYYKVENTIEVLKVPTSYEKDRDAFIAALPVTQWVNSVSKLKY